MASKRSESYSSGDNVKYTAEANTTRYKRHLQDTQSPWAHTLHEIEYKLQLMLTPRPIKDVGTFWQSFPVL